MAKRVNRPWKVVFGACLCWTLIVGITRCFGLFYSEIIERLNTTRTAAATVISIQNGVRCLLAPGVVIVTDRLGIPLTVIVGGMLFSVGIMTSVLYPSILTLYITFGVICGMGASIVVVVPYISVNESFIGDSCHSMAMSLATTGVGIGTIIFGPIIEWLLSTYGYDGALLMMGAIMLNICVGGALLKAPPKRHVHIIETSEEAPLLADKDNNPIPAYIVQPEGAQIIQKAEARDIQPVQNGQGTSHVAQNGNKWQNQKKKMKAWLMEMKSAFTMSLFLFMFCMMIMSTVIFSSLLFIDELGIELNIPANGTAVVLVVMGVTDIIGRFVFGAIFDLKLAQNRKHFLLAILGCALGVVTFGMGVTSNYMQLLILSGVYGILEGGYSSQAMTSICELIPRPMLNQAISVAIAIQGIGQFTGPVFQGLLNDHFNTSRAAYTTSGLVFAFASLLCVINYCVKRCTIPHCCKPEYNDELQ